MILVWLYPLLLLLMLVPLVDRTAMEKGDPDFRRQGFVASLFMLPWVAIVSGLSLLVVILAAQLSLALALTALRKSFVSEEIWVKQVISTFLGFSLLIASVEPQILELPFALNSHLQAVGLALALLLLFGLPPLQLGGVDAAAAPQLSMQVLTNMAWRGLLGFVLVLAFQDLAFKSFYEPWLVAFVVILLLALAASRLILRVQMTPGRTLAYWSSGFVLAPVAEILSNGWGSWVWVLLVILQLPLLLALSARPQLLLRHTPSDRGSFAFYARLRRSLGLEAALSLAVAGLCAYQQQWVLAAAFSILMFANITAALDREAFAVL